MKRIKSFKIFNEDIGDTYIVPYKDTVYVEPNKDPDIIKNDTEDESLLPKVPQFNIVKTISVILMDKGLSKIGASIFPDTDLVSALKNPNMLNSVDIEKLQ